MLYTIQKDFEFSASHHLEGLPDDHPCSRLHGHNYVARVILASETLNQVGFVRDYRELDELKVWINNNWDHHDLNDYFTGIYNGNPSAENIAQYLYDRFCDIYPELIGVGISETNKTWAFYLPIQDDMKVASDE